MLDKSDSRNLFIAYARDENSTGCNDEYDELNIYFEDWRKCIEIRDYHIEEKRKRQILWERDRIEKFLIEHCESEINHLFSQ